MPTIKVQEEKNFVVVSTYLFFVPNSYFYFKIHIFGLLCRRRISSFACILLNSKSACLPDDMAVRVHNVYSVISLYFLILFYLS